jgi:hypothetical protein
LDAMTPEEELADLQKKFALLGECPAELEPWF